MDRLNAQLWLGAEYDVLDLNAMQKNGIVLNMTHQADELPRECQYLQLNQDDGAPFDQEALRRGLVFIGELTARNNVVLIHCAAGISRTAAMAIAWLMAGGFSWDESERMVKNARPITLPHPELKRSVLQFFRRWPYDGSLTDGL